jgi:hypothetical protein
MRLLLLPVIVLAIPAMFALAALVVAAEEVTRVHG